VIALFRWPEAALVGRLIPKERLYVEAGVTNAVRRRFVEEVQRIRWAYKLGEESLRLAGSETVPEIQVFEIDLKGSALDDAVLAAIDRAIPSPIIFELRRDDGLRAERAATATYKRQAGARRAAPTDYFRTGWVTADGARVPLPAALDMDGLYAQLIGALLPHPLRRGEELSDGIDRIARIRKLEREIAALDKRMRAEPQFNRKVELRRDLRARRFKLAAITNEERTTEDATWRS
jgi:hypothetical protein